MLDGKHRRCHTKHLPLTGARATALRPPTRPRSTSTSPVGTAPKPPRCGPSSPPTPPSASHWSPGLPYLRAEAVYAVRAEMARTLDDVLDRRTRCRLLDRDATAAAAESVARLLAPEWGWDDATTTAAVAAYRADLEHERAASEPPVSATPAA